MISKHNQDDYSVEFGTPRDCFLRATRCLLKERDKFQKSPPNSQAEDSAWLQYEKRLQEFEMYRAQLPDEEADLLVMHVIQSKQLNTPTII